MKKIKNKGFTLTEILAVIAVITIIALLVTAGIMGYFRRGKEDYDKKLTNQLVLASKTYFAEHKEELPTSANKKGYAYVTLPAMQSNNYIAKSFVDSEGRECSPSYVYVKQRPNNPNEYDYYPCLVCQDKDGNKTWHTGSDNKYCDPKNWEGGDPTDPSGPIDPVGPVNPQQPDDEEKCVYTKTDSSVTITEASMPAGILRIYYIDDNGEDHLIYSVDQDATDNEENNESNKTTFVNNITVTDITNVNSVYIEDVNQKTTECENQGGESGPTGCTKYNSCKDPSCGCAKYVYTRRSACGCQTYNRSSSCGCQTYKSKRSSACGCAKYKSKKSCTKCGHTTAYTTKTVSGNGYCPACPHGYSKIGKDTYTHRNYLGTAYKCTRRCRKKVTTCNTCRNSSFGCQTYKSCRLSSNGCETYKRCKSAGCAKYKSCKKCESYKSCENKKCGCAN